jgi:RNA polymerase sigma factor (TIGR02999 family)
VAPAEARRVYWPLVPGEGNETHELTILLQRWGEGDDAARDALLPLVYDSLRRLAARHLGNERRPSTLQPTALVHEVYMKMAGTTVPGYANRGQFFGIAARMMRQVLVDEARSRLRQKRGGGAFRVELDESSAIAREEGADVLALHDQVEELLKFDERRGKIVELRYFGGFTEEEAADLMGISTATVRRDMRLAEAWLRSRLFPKE